LLGVFLAITSKVHGSVSCRPRVGSANKHESEVDPVRFTAQSQHFPQTAAAATIIIAPQNPHSIAKTAIASQTPTTAKTYQK